MNQGNSLVASQTKSFYAVSAMGIISCVSAAIFGEPFLALIPFGFLFAYLALVNYKLIFFGFFVLLPFSIEVTLPGGLGTDLPSEPIMWFLTTLSFILFLWKGKTIQQRLITNPISLVLILHLLWIFICSLMSTYPVISIKFFLAKLWYVIPFFFLPLLILNSKKDHQIIFRYFIYTSIIAVAYVMINHAASGFSFADINFAVRPIFRNHVNYAALLVLLVPFIWAMSRITKEKKFLFFLLFFLVAVYFTYTRAAYGVIFLCVAMYFVIKWKLLKWFVPLAFVVLAYGLNTMIKGNEYLELAPQYEKTVSHTKFNNLIEATYKMEDISTMERLYRWVAGFHMVKEKPFFGFGPSTFYSNYQRHTVNSFQTYVSDNPEKSGIHNYYLMTLVEQGVFGLIILFCMILLPLFVAQKAYAQFEGHQGGYWIMAAALSYFATAVMILINDLLEADKVGPLFFLSASIIAFYAFLVPKPSNINSIIDDK